jgi:ABC-type phosphate transport system ATPase subunit
MGRPIITSPLCCALGKITVVRQDRVGTPGQIVQAGPTASLFENPADPRTADYMHGRFG